MDRPVIECLEQYSWPGNVREIQNIAQRIMAIHSGTIITVSELPDVLHKAQIKSGVDLELPDEGMDLEALIDNVILKALDKNQWNQSRTAAFLNISRNSLIYRMNKNRLKGG